MKKLVAVFFVVCVLAAGATVVLAKTILLPAGAVVTAQVNTDGTAVITPPAGWSVEYYGYEGIKNFPVGPTTINLRNGRRFQVKDQRGVYALLTPDMAAYPPDFFGLGVGMDCSNAKGCTFIVTGK